MKERIYRKGDVFLAHLGIPHGSEQGGKRPIVIIQNDDGCIYSPTITMVPMTTVIKKPHLKTHYILKHSIFIRYRSMVEAEQVQTIDKDRLIRWIGHLDARDIAGIEEAVRNHFGFDIPDCIEAP
ncbi:MAG: type II toxin-antitoxin system PemK/MazF family toxin [Erysipelotrichaceae bacterium]|nr:type II toxin-antitoxin system PemK/MazF family toxin [Erysipelotrichaceae bacterium]